MVYVFQCNVVKGKIRTRVCAKILRIGIYDIS